MKEQTQNKLEYKILYSLVVAGKSATFAENAMGKLLGIKHVSELDGNSALSPFDYLRWISAQPGGISLWVKACRTGNYTKLERAFKVLVESSIDLRACTPEELEKVPGIGPKTSRFFILWTRPDARYAALDTHILKWLKYLGYDAPKSTPTGKKYRELEEAFLVECDKAGMKPALMDAMIWEYCRDGLHKDGVFLTFKPKSNE